MTISDLSAPAGRPLTGRGALVLAGCFFGIVFLTNAVMVVMALSTMPGTVVESSFKAGNDFGRDIAAFQAQAALGWRAEADVIRQADGAIGVAVHLRDDKGAAIPDLVVTARLGRPTSKRTDQQLALSEQGAGRYGAAFTNQGQGLYDLEMIASRAGARVFRTINRIDLR